MWCVQDMWDLGWVDRITVINRQDCCQERIMCYQLELMDEFQNIYYTYTFASSANSYTFRDPVIDPATKASCSYSPPPPPMGPRPSTALCNGAAGEFIRFVRISWKGGCAKPSDGWLNVAELQVWYNGQNVAAGKSGTEIDTWTNNAAYKAAQLTDGKTWTMFHSGSLTAFTFVTIDLQVRETSCVRCTLLLHTCGMHVAL
jgi:hypothetical protein